MRDFLNIFEYTQKHACDLICLKTEIDTTSPYSNMVTKMLMVFAEFEREVTAERIHRNAYERSKRGLAYGGFAPLGYKRDPEHKGRLLADENADIVKDIFSVYLNKRSLLESLKIIKKKYNHPRVAKLSRNGIYGILTSKVYIGIREIRISDAIEEVPGVWEPIINKDIFHNVQNILKTNGPGPRSPRFAYLFSGLIRCAKCGKKFQGKSGKGRSGQARYYYAHSGRCADGGLHSIEAEDAHRLVLDWLEAISKNKERFADLAEDGLDKITKRLRTLNSTLKRLDYEDAALRKKLADSTARTLAGKASATTELMEKEAEQLLSQIQRNERETELLRSEAETLTTILNISDANFFQIYSERIRKFLALSDRDKCRLVSEVFKSLRMGEQTLSVELIHPNGKKFTGDTVTIVHNEIALPGVLLLRSRAHLRRLYREEKLSARSIAKKNGASPSAVSDYLQKNGLVAEEKATRPQQVPFGYDYKKGKLVQNRSEQQTIRTVRELRSAGLTLRDIAAHLNRKLISTKRGGVWTADRVWTILLRLKGKRAIREKF